MRSDRDEPTCLSVAYLNVHQPTIKMFVSLMKTQNTFSIVFIIKDLSLAGLVFVIKENVVFSLKNKITGLVSGKDICKSQTLTFTV